MCILTAGAIAAGVSSLGLGSITASGISAGAGVLGAGLGAVGALSTAESNASMARYQSQVAANNAKTAQQNAAYSTQAGEVKAGQESETQRQASGALATELAAGGFDINTGTPAALRTQGVETGVTDVERTRQAAALQRYGYQTQATSYGAESKLETAAAGFDETAGIIGAGAALTKAIPSLPGTAGSSAPSTLLTDDSTTVPSKFAWMQGGGLNPLYGGSGAAF